MGRWRTWIAVLVTVAGLGLMTPATAGAATGCAVTWGSQDKAARTLGSGSLTNVRGGRSACYDRLVLDLGSGSSSPGYAVRYVPFVGQGESGNPLPLRGGAFLEVTVQRPAYDPQTGAPTYSPANPHELVAVGGWQTLASPRPSPSGLAAVSGPRARECG